MQAHTGVQRPCKPAPVRVSKHARSACFTAQQSTAVGKSVNAARGKVVVAHTAAPAAPDAATDAATNSNVYDTVVVGAGVSGLCTAQALASRHSDGVTNFLVTEARERVGGNITSMSNDKFVWEEGPNSFQPNDSMLEIAVDAKVADQLVFGDPKAPRFVFWEKKLRAVPDSPVSGVTFDLMSLPGKIRAGLGAIGLKPPAPEGVEESVEQFIRRNLGDEVFYRLIEPFCSGVYAGDPTKLSMKAAFGKIWQLESKGGSLVGGAIKLMQEKASNPSPPRDPKLPPKPKGQTVGSFRNGLKTLPEAIAANLSSHIRCSWKLNSIKKSDSGLYTLTYDTPDGKKTVQTKTVALTVPAYTVAALMKDSVPRVSDALSRIDYPPVCAVTLAYPQSDICDDRKDAEGNVPGFGQLHPRTQGITTLGTIYSSSLFPGRAPAGTMLVLCYIGGATNRGIMQQSEDDIVKQVDKDLRAMLLKPHAAAPQVVGVRKWERAIPQFNVGHDDAVADANAALQQQQWNGVLLGGNYVSGVALGKCVEYAFEFANIVADAVKKTAASK